MRSNNIAGVASMMRSISSLTQVVNLKSVIISLLAVVSTWLCVKLSIKADFPLTLIATAIVFPLVFSIGTAYTRREKALEEYGAIKANGRVLYIASRDWLPKRDPKRDQHLKSALHQLLSGCRDMYKGPLNEAPPHEKLVYESFQQLSDFVTEMRAQHLSPTECSRLNQYISRMITAFENTRNIYEYRTPRTLRAFSDFFILLLPVLYGPYFAYEAEQFLPEFFFIMPVLFTLILVGLANIQDDLENPFDQIGIDDVAIDPDRFIASLDMGLTSPEGALGKSDGEALDNSDLQATDTEALAR
jgi:predicted membrane chloride channel (bestrophin family)